MTRYSVNEAADLGLRPGEVRQATRNDELEAEADGRDFLIQREDLEKCAAEHDEEHGIELDADDLDDDDLDDRVKAAIEEHRPSWEAGSRSGSGVPEGTAPFISVEPPGPTRALCDWALRATTSCLAR